MGLRCAKIGGGGFKTHPAKRPTRERENLVGERTRIINRMKACLVRFGIRNFKPTLRKASERLNELCTPEGTTA